MLARTGTALATVAAVALSAGGALVACFDLLHSTADVLTACELDAAHPGCAAADESSETDFCMWTPAQAAQHALHACTWLGACETPMGNNAFGPCYFRALLAYDCAANPNHPARHAAHDLWDCLQQVRSCADVDACIFVDGKAPACGGHGVYTRCGENAANPNVRVRCADGGVEPYPRSSGENCALWGQTCAPSPEGSACAGEPTGHACGHDCTGSLLHWCAPADDGGPGVDLGIDCASNGATQCDGFPSPDAAVWLACKAESDAAPCVPNASATCENGRATMCPSGVPETLDCAALLGGAGACTGGGLSPPFDWTSPCSMKPSACTSDSCDGDRLTSCERGAAFSADCASEGLGACSLVAADPGAAPRAACGPPAP
jgi:hypothetical protein